MADSRIPAQYSMMHRWPAPSTRCNRVSGMRAARYSDMEGGAAELGVDLDEHIAFVIEALQGVADQIGLAGNEMGHAAGD